MRKYMDKLELTYKSVRIKNIQKIFNGVLIVLGFVLSIIILALSGVSISPFYFPLDFLLLFLMVMLLVFSLTAIAFRYLQIRYSKSDSAIYLMAKNSLKKSIALIIVSGLILAVPILLTYTQGELTESGSYDYAVGPTYFTNRDRLALTTTTSVTVWKTTDTVSDIQIWVMTAEDYDRGAFDSPNEIIYADDAVGERKDVFYRPGSGYKENVIHIVDPFNTPVSYEIEAEASPFIVNFIPILAIISIIAQSIWVGYLLPIMRRYASLSIYSRRYVYETGAPDRTITPDKKVKFEVAVPGTKPVPVSNDALAKSKGMPSDGIGVEGVDVDALLADARTNFNKGEYDKALKEFNRVLIEEPRNPMALVGKAKTLDTMNRYKEALECYDLLLTINPNMESNWIQTGDLLVKLARTAEAAERYNTALSLNPKSVAQNRLLEIETDVQYLLTKASELSGLGKFDEALRYYDIVLKQESDNLRALTGKSIALKEMKRFDECITVLKEILEIDSYNSTALDSLIRCYEEKLRKDPSDEDTWVARGDLLVELGKKDEGMMCFLKAQELNPNNEEAKIRIEDLSQEHIADIDESDPTVQELLKISGVGKARAREITNAGYDSIMKLAEASVEDLAKVKGLNERLAQKIIASMPAVPA